MKVLNIPTHWLLVQEYFCPQTVFSIISHYLEYLSLEMIMRNNVNHIYYYFTWVRFQGLNRSFRFSGHHSVNNNINGQSRQSGYEEIECRPSACHHSVWLNKLFFWSHVCKNQQVFPLLLLSNFIE